MTTDLTEEERAILRVVQTDMPLSADPWAEVAQRAGVAREQVLATLRKAAQAGLIHRIGPVFNHRRMGWLVDALVVLDVPDDMAEMLGTEVAALPFVTHCYLRRRHAPDWPYNLYARVHGRVRAEVEGKVAQMVAACKPHLSGFDVLYAGAALKRESFHRPDIVRF